MSHWTTLRERTKDVLLAAGITGGNVEVGRFMPTKDAELPKTLVYVRSETLGADGSARSGASAFVNQLDLRVKIRVRSEDDSALEAKLDEPVQTALDATLKNDAWWGDDIEGVEAVTISYDEAETGSYVGEAEISLTVLYRSIFEPDVEDDLDIVAVSEPQTGSGAFIQDLSDNEE